MSVQVVQVPAEVTQPLRRAVLRPHQELPDLERADAAATGTVYFAARDGDAVVGTASVRPEPAPWAPDQPAWRLRGVATAESRRGQGVGAQVLAAVVEHVAAAGGGTLWCNARTPARRFYEREGFTVVGEPWTDPDTGPHVQMTTEVDPR